MKDPNLELQKIIDDTVKDAKKDIDNYKNVLEETTEDLKVESNINVEISKDKMKAFISLTPAIGTTPPTIEDIKDILNQKGVVFGVDDDKIKEILDREIYYTKMLVAQGKEAVNGQDGKINYLFKIRRDLKPRVSKDGKADFYNLDLITNVKKGQQIAEIIPPTDGTEGQTVTGQKIPFKPGREARIVAGKNIQISNEGKIFSTIDGQPNIINGKLSVVPVLEIRGDVGPATGNINFLGSVIVNGNVKSGFKISVEKDIEVKGTVEAAELIAKGNIVIRRGVQGRGMGLLKAGLDIAAGYLENVTAVAGQNIHITEAVMHSKISAEKKIIVDGRKGLFVGGAARVGEELIAKIIGSPMCTYTEIEAGLNPQKKQELQRINKALDTENHNINKTKQAISVLEKLNKKGVLPTDKTIILGRLKTTYKKLIENRSKLLESKQKIEELLKCTGRAKISAADVVHPGVHIIIGNASLKIKDRVEHATFYNYEGNIKFSPYEG